MSFTELGIFCNNTCATALALFTRSGQQQRQRRENSVQHWLVRSELHRRLLGCDARVLQARTRPPASTYRYPRYSFRPNAHACSRMHATVCHTTQALSRARLLAVGCTADSNRPLWPIQSRSFSATEWVGLHSAVLCWNRQAIAQPAPHLRAGKSGTAARGFRATHRVATQRTRQCEMGRRTRRMHGTTSSRESSSGL